VAFSNQLRRATLVVALMSGLGCPPAARAGRFRVGVTTVTFTRLSTTTGAPRPLPTLIWYPAAAHTGTADPFGLRDAGVHRGRFPLIVFSHGSCGRPSEATYLTRALASEGFVVAAPAHPGNTADDGFATCASGPSFADSLLNRVPDIRFTIDALLAEAAAPASRFAHRLRADAIGMSGLSFGGYTTLRIAQEEPRVRVALTMVPGGVAAIGASAIVVPTMVIGAEHDHVVGFADSEKAYQRLAGPRFLVELLGGDHLNVVDDCSVLCGDIAPATGHDLVLHYALPFFRRYLGKKQVPARLLVRPVPGVQLEAEPRRSPPASG
jgi:predicted dienelactone hydrolase